MTIPSDLLPWELPSMAMTYLWGSYYDCPQQTLHGEWSNKRGTERGGMLVVVAHPFQTKCLYKHHLPNVKQRKQLFSATSPEQIQRIKIWCSLSLPNRKYADILTAVIQDVKLLNKDVWISTRSSVGYSICIRVTLLTAQLERPQGLKNQSTHYFAFTLWSHECYWNVHWSRK